MFDIAIIDLNCDFPAPQRNDCCRAIAECLNQQTFLGFIFTIGIKVSASTAYASSTTKVSKLGYFGNLAVLKHLGICKD
ncbi:MAG: hypothetical protein H7A42_07510 [Chlamydiales bacterium]|nr:hypothetical protein [Chlamydiales bacterium]